MSDLREQIIERIELSYRNYGTDWGPLADEVIRQMEFARLAGLKQGLTTRGLRPGMVTESASGAEELKRIVAVRPLTLAPPGWEP